MFFNYVCLDFLVALALNHKISANRVSGISLLTQVLQWLPHTQHLRPTSLRTAVRALSPRLHLLCNELLVILERGQFQPSELLPSPGTLLLLQTHQLYHLPAHSCSPRDAHPSLHRHTRSHTLFLKRLVPSWSLCPWQAQGIIFLVLRLRFFTFSWMRT